MSKRSLLRLFAVLCGIFATQVVTADLILSAPPRETPEAGIKTYGPLADYLSKVTGQKIVYQYSANWGLYQALMTMGQYDLVFDGPHFVSWRDAHLKHVPIAALAGTLGFVIVARQDDTHVHTLADLSGKGVCGHAPPNLATLTLFSQFTNPSRQPMLVETQGFGNAYKALLARKCSGTVLPVDLYHKLDDQAKRTRVLYESTAYPNQALTAGPRVPEAVREQIRQALLSASGKLESHSIAAALGGSDFVAATVNDYKGYDALLNNVWGFDGH